MQLLNDPSDFGREQHILTCYAWALRSLEDRVTSTLGTWKCHLRTPGVVAMLAGKSAEFD